MTVTYCDNCGRADAKLFCFGPPGWTHDSQGATYGDLCPVCADMVRVMLKKTEPKK